MDVTIRKAETGDIDGIINLLLQISLLHRKGRPDICNGGQSYTPEELELLIKDRNRHSFVAVVDAGYVVGLCLCEIMRYTEAKFMSKRTLLYIHDFGVDESYRSQGIGTKLFSAVKEYAASIGAYDIELGVWEFNKNAIQFYERCGFSVQRRRMELIL